MAPKSTDGTVPTGWPESGFNLTDTLAAHGITGVGEWGFQEGDAAQYTWMVPQDLAGLITDLGGNAAATRQLEQYFSQLNVGPTAPYDWAGNEPNLGTPFEGDYMSAPWLTEQTTTEILDRFYTDAPDGEPGNDDLGVDELVGGLVDARPLPRDTRHDGAGDDLPDVHNCQPPPRRRQGPDDPHPKERPGAGYISSMTVDGRNWNRPWLAAQMAVTGGTVDETSSRKRRTDGERRRATPRRPIAPERRSVGRPSGIRPSSPLRRPVRLSDSPGDENDACATWPSTPSGVRHRGDAAHSRLPLAGSCRPPRRPPEVGAGMTGPDCTNNGIELRRALGRPEFAASSSVIRPEASILSTCSTILSSFIDVSSPVLSATAELSVGARSRRPPY